MSFRGFFVYRRLPFAIPFLCVRTPQRGGFGGRPLAAKDDSPEPWKPYLTAT